MDIFKLVGSIYIDNTEANESLSKTESQAESTGSKFAGLGSTVATTAVAVGTAAVEVGKTLWGLAEDASSSGDEIQKGAQKLGMSYEAYQKLSYACEYSGTSIEHLSKGMVNITNDLADAANGVEGATDAYNALGVSVTDANGNMRSSEDVLQDTLMALADMDDETARNAAANDIFGKSYTDLLPLLNSGSEGIQGMMDQCENLGLVMSDESVDASANFGDALADITNTMDSVKTEVGAALLPMLTNLMKWITSHTPQIRQVITSAISAIMKVVQALMPAFQALAPGVTAAVNVVIKVIKALLPIITQIATVISKVVTTAVSAFQSLGSKISGIFTNIKTTIKGAINGVIEVFNKFIRGINKLKIPDWVPSVGGKGINIKEIPKLARGGTATQPGSAIVGEAGPELVQMPTGAKVTPLSNNDVEDALNAILAAIQKNKADTREAMMDAIQSVKWKWNERELGRMVREYAG